MIINELGMFVAGIRYEDLLFTDEKLKSPRVLRLTEKITVEIEKNLDQVLTRGRK